MPTSRFGSVAKFPRRTSILVIATLVLVAFINRPKCTDSDCDGRWSMSRVFNNAHLEDAARLHTTPPHPQNAPHNSHAHAHGHSHSLAELEEGQWIALMPYAQPNLSTEWRGAYQSTEFAGPSEDGLSGAALDSAREERARRLVGWGWSGEGTLAELDAEALVVRALASTGGIVLVGDSTQLQFFEHLMHSLPSPLTYSLESTLADATRRPRSAPALPSAADGMRTVLVHSSDYVAELLRRAGAPPERLSRPLLRFVRDDLLLSAARFGALAFDATPDQLSDLVSQNWPDVLRDAVNPIETGDAVWEGKSKTILVLNSGARWAESFYQHMQRDVLSGIYGTMVDETIYVLSTFANTMHALYRPSTPGHASCESFTAPVRFVENLEQLDYTKHHGWDLFPAFNEHWLDGLRASHSRSHVGEEPDEDEKPPGYLPVYQRSLLRPDAHRNPPLDCLHQAGPSVLDQWARWLLQEAQHMDEDQVV